MTQAQKHHDLISTSRGMAEMTRHLQLASNDCIADEYEDFDDRMGQTLECLTALEFADGSRLERTGPSVWADGAWSVANAAD